MLLLTLRSVLWQEEVELEVVIVDDGSRDDVASAVAGVRDVRVRFFRHDRPLGVSAARNRGVAEARGRWIAFLDDDDVWAPDKLLAQLRSAEEQSRRWAYVGAVIVTEDLRVIGGAPPSSPDEVASRLPQANLIPGGCSGVAVRSDLLPAEPFDDSYRHFADWDLWIRLAKVDQPAGVSRPMLGYRVHRANASLDTVGMIAELDVIEHRYVGPVDRARFYRHVARVSQRVSRRGEAMRYYLRAAMRDQEYRRHGLPSDLVEIARGAGREARCRLMGVPVRGANNERRAISTWGEEAIPWLEDLRVRWLEGTGGPP